MNTDMLEGKWKEIQGDVRERWGRLTNDDMTRIGGKRDKLEGVLQQRYGYTKERARAEVNSYLSNLMDRGNGDVADWQTAVSDTLDEGRARVNQYQDQLMDRMPERPATVAKDNPWLLLALVLVVGIVVGLMLRPSQD